MSADLVGMKTWYDQAYASAGGMDAWVWETVNGRDFHTREPHFRAFCVPPDRLDRTAALVASTALQMKKTVLGLNAQNQLLSVTSLRERDDEAGGWVVCGTPIRG